MQVLCGGVLSLWLNHFDFVVNTLVSHLGEEKKSEF